MGHVAIDDPSGVMMKSKDVVKKFSEITQSVLVNAEVVLEDKLPGKTISQQICAFVSASNTHYLVLGIDGMKKYMEQGPRGVMGSVTDACIKDARCTVICCKKLPKSVT